VFCRVICFGGIEIGDVGVLGEIWDGGADAFIGGFVYTSGDVGRVGAAEAW
jgi:hypothetical protein